MTHDPTATKQSPAPRSFATNAALSAVSEISLALLFLLVIIAARLLGDAQFGVFAFAMAFVNVFGALMEGGLSFVYARAVARDPSLAEKHLGNILTLQLLFCFAGIVITLVAINLVDVQPEARLAVYLFAGAESLRFIKQLYRFVFRTANRFDIEAVTVTIERVLLLVVGAAVLYAGYGVVGFAWSFLIVRVLDVLIVVVASSRALFPPRLRLDFSLWPGLLREAAPFIIIAALVMLLFRVDNLMLGLMTSNAEVGWYNAAYSVLEGLYIVPKIITNLLYPAFSRAHHEPEAITRLLDHAVRYALLVAVPVIIVGVVLAEDITLFVYGEQYARSTVALQILLLGTFFLFMHEIGFVLLGAIDRQRVAVMLFAVALLVKVATNLLLIPRIGYIGAAVSTVLAEGLFAVVAMVYIAKLGYRVPLLRLLTKPALAAGVVGVGAHLVSLPILVALPLCAVVYFALLTWLQYWRPDESRTFAEVRGRLRARLLR
jgi:PST family polysaccharide transporter